jgi:hypothetical protein
MLVAGGGFEPLSGIDNTEDADSTMGEMGTMGSVTVQIQYKMGSSFVPIRLQNTGTGYPPNCWAKRGCVDSLQANRTSSCRTTKPIFPCMEWPAQYN